VGLQISQSRVQKSRRVGLLWCYCICAEVPSWHLRSLSFKSLLTYSKAGNKWKFSINSSVVTFNKQVRTARQPVSFLAAIMVSHSLCTCWRQSFLPGLWVSVEHWAILS